MMKSNYILFLCLSLSVISFSQNIENSKNSVYLDLAGIGGFGSLNYSREFIEIGLFEFEAHAGLSTTKLNDFKTKFNPQIIIPFGVHGTFGNKHSVEVGLGSAYISSVRANYSYEPERYSTINGNASIGYKYMKKKGGFLFRAYYSPLFEQFQGITHWGGISFGFAF